MPYPLVRSIAADGNSSPRDQGGRRRRAFANHFKTAGQHPYTEDPIATLVSAALHRGGSTRPPPIHAIGAIATLVSVALHQGVTSTLLTPASGSRSRHSLVSPFIKVGGPPSF
jgi:hypothetical protein